MAKHKTPELIKWQLYEDAKDDLKRENLTPLEYNRRIKIIIKELGL